MLKDRLRKIRKEKKLSLDALAKKAGSSKSYMWELEHRSLKISAELLRRIALALDVTPEYLLTGNASKYDFEMVFLEDFRKLSLDKQKKLRDIMIIINKEGSYERN